jgi:hypothetical protein
MAILEMDQGLKKLAVGVSNVRARCDRMGALVVTSGGADYMEMVQNGIVMTAANAVAGVAHGTAFGTGAPLTLWNPPNSGVNLVIIHVSVGYVSGTLGAGFYAFGGIAQATAPTGTELVPVNNLIGWPRGIGRAFTGANSSGGTPTIIRPSFSYGPFLATSVLAPAESLDLVNGGIIVTQGSLLAIQGVGTAGTSPLLVHCIKYAEVPA